MEQLKAYINGKGIGVIGDMPMYVSMDSCDVWSHRERFDLDPRTGRPCRVAGVPPDYFSADGQLWGNPLYNWPAMERDGFAWWCARIGVALSRFDVVRIDHFRAFASYWAVPADAETRESGSWLSGQDRRCLTRQRGSFRLCRLSRRISVCSARTSKGC